MGLAAPPTSLKPVIDVLPDSVYDNPTWRGMAYFWRDTAMYVALLALLVVVTNVAEVLVLEVAMGLVVSGLFVVGHDAAHGALFSSKRRNSTVAHLAMLPSFHVYEGWVLGHNRVHHPYTVRQGYDFVWHPDDAGAVRRTGLVAEARPPLRVVLGRRRGLLRPPGLVEEDDDGAEPGPVGQGHPPRPLDRDRLHRRDAGALHAHRPGARATRWPASCGWTSARCCSPSSPSPT